MNLNENVAANFKLKEFTKSEVTKYQLGMIKALARQLQILRCLINSVPEFRKDPNKEISITITSGVRTLDDYNRLKAKGYNPSATSDHFYGSKPGTLGAVDCVFSNLKVDLFDLFKYIVGRDAAGKVYFGQILYESNPKTGSTWIHLSNDSMWIFRDEYFREAYRRSMRYGYSKDNGKTFTEYNPINIKELLKNG